MAWYLVKNRDNFAFYLHLCSPLLEYSVLHKVLLPKGAIIYSCGGLQRTASAQLVYVKVAGGWRRLHNEELHNLYALPNMIRVTKLR